MDVFGHALADAGEIGELGFVLGEFLDAIRQAANQFGGFFVAAIAADDRAVDFEKLGGFAEDSGDFAFSMPGL